MTTAIHPWSGQHEPCTRTSRPFFEGDPVLVDVRGVMTPAMIDTVDLDGDENFCRIRFAGSPVTEIVLVGELRPHPRRA